MALTAFAVLLLLAPNREAQAIAENFDGSRPEQSPVT